MIKYQQKIITIMVLFSLLISTAWAAPAVSNSVTNVRFSQKAEAVRIVFDLDKSANYQVTTANNGTRIIIDFADTQNKSKLAELAIKDPLVQKISFTILDKNKFRAVIDLTRNSIYKVNTLQNPSRFYIDLIKNYDQKLVAEVMPGLKHITLVRSNEKGMLTAHVLDVDLKAGFRLRPALANGQIAGRETLSSIASSQAALAAINASYFDVSGEIFGLTMVDSTVVSTTYLTRTAFGMLGDMVPVIDEIGYNGSVTLPNGSIIPIAGVNTQRGADSLVLYNSYYAKSTGTNPYGQEYIVKDGVIIGINGSNTSLATDSVVLSAHGSVQAQMAGLKIGDKVVVEQNLGQSWQGATQILGIGPRLIKDGSIYLTTKREEFGGDVAGGRAPRTAVGITRDNHVLLAVIDGRQPHSVGCTLLELAMLLQEFGAVDAVNFDGGGSTEMIIKNEIINSPSEGVERKIGNALVVLPKQG